MSIESVMPSSHPILCHPLLLLPLIPPSIRVFSNESTLHMRWSKYWSFSFSIIPSKEHQGLIIFQNGLVGSPCSPRDSQESYPKPQFKSINSLVLSFLTVQLSRPYMTNWKNHSLDQTDLCWQSNVSAFEYAIQVGHNFPSRSKCLLILWLQSPSAVILEPPKIKPDTVSTVSPSICHEVMGPDAMILVF